jgi:hypothetical protein
MALLAGVPFTIPAFAGQGAGAAPAAAQEQQALAQKLANPISDLVSVPFQFNWEQNVGPGEQTRFVLNVQPVMPFSLNADWNLIARVIVPFVSQPPLFEGGAPASGVSDVLTSFFFSPKKGGLIWGVGPGGEALHVRRVPSELSARIRRVRGTSGHRAVVEGTRCDRDPAATALRGPPGVGGAVVAVDVQGRRPGAHRGGESRVGPSCWLHSVEWAGMSAAQRTRLSTSA